MTQPAPGSLPTVRIGKTAALLFVLVSTFAVYVPALRAGFVGDDFMILHRLRALHGLGESLEFFRGEFFGYYRPLAFVSHALDWLVAGANPHRFHLTNLVIHLANTSLVFLIASSPALAGSAPARRIAAGTIAALLFGMHASNHEAVIWASARFDLLATFWSLLALWWIVGRNVEGPDGWNAAIAGMLFFPALLSKESAVTLPVAAAAWAAFVMRTTTAEAIRRTAPWVVALVVYAILRSVAGGVGAAGGAGRLPKLIGFAALLAIVLALGSERWLQLRAWLLPRRGFVMSLFAAVVGAAAVAAAGLGGSIAALVREKLAVAGFAIFHLLSPIVNLTETPYFLDPETTVYWLGGITMLAVLALLVTVLWRRLLERDAAWFAVALIAATMVPISALTEGKRYLYLPSAAVSVLAAMLILEIPRRRRRLAGIVVAAYITVSAWQITGKTADWIWAGRMTAEGAALADGSLAPACGGRVVFLTSPVALRGVYTHFYYETFELPRGCRPDVFHVLVRVLRLDTVVEVRRDGPDRFVITAPDYRGNFVLSRDLRHFDVPLRAIREVTVDTPLGAVQAEAFGGEQRITLTLASDVVADDIRFFYYSNGSIRSVLP